MTALAALRFPAGPACAGADPDLFFPLPGESTAAALRDPAPAASAEQEPEAWHSYIPASRPPGEPTPRWPFGGHPVPADPALEAAVEELERGWRTPQPDVYPLPEREMEAVL